MLRKSTSYQGKTKKSNWKFLSKYSGLLHVIVLTKTDFGIKKKKSQTLND